MMRTALACSVTLLSMTGIHAFGPTLFGTRSSFSSTALGISSWGPRGPPHRWKTAEKLEDPETRIQSYLDEPQQVYARGDIDGTCLVSGLVKSQERTDQTVFDMLNLEESAFEFSKIVAHVNDVAFAKKRLLSRSARYSGLLDKLDFMQAETPDSLPTLEQLKGVRNWVVFLEDDLLEQARQITQLANDSPDLMNFAILMTNAHGLDVQECHDVVEGMKKHHYEYTIIAVGKLEDHPEGSEYYQLRQFGEDEGQLKENAIFSREEAFRILTDCFQLTCGGNEAFTVSEVYNVNQTEARLIRGLRQAGYARPQEMDHMVQDGPKNYQDAINEYKEGNPRKGGGKFNNWWEAPEYQEDAKKQEEKAQLRADAEKDAVQLEIEQIATEWAKREYFRKSMAGTLEDADMSEDDFIKSVWDRAMFEGDLKYRQSRGESPNEESELADFRLVQEKKKQTMLKRAQEELNELLQDDGSSVVTSASNEDDDDEE